MYFADESGLSANYHRGIRPRLVARQPVKRRRVLFPFRRSRTLGATKAEFHAEIVRRQAAGLPPIYARTEAQSRESQTPAPAAVQMIQRPDLYGPGRAYVPAQQQPRENLPEIWDIEPEYTEGAGLGKSWKKKLKKVAKKAGRVVSAPVRAVVKVQKKTFKSVAKVATKTGKAVSKGARTVGKSTGRILKSVANAPLRIVAAPFKTAGKLFAKPGGGGGGEGEAAQELPPPEEMAPEQMPAEEAAAEPVPGYEEAQPSEIAPDQYSGDYAEPSYMPDTTQGSELVAPEEVPEEEDAEVDAAPDQEVDTEAENADPEGTEAENTDPGGEEDNGAGLATLAITAVTASQLGLLPAIVGAASTPTGQKLIKGIGKLFKKKKKTVIVQAAPAPAKPKPAAAPAAGLPKWAIPAGIGALALIVVFSMSGGSGGNGYYYQRRRR